MSTVAATIPAPIAAERPVINPWIIAVSTARRWYERSGYLRFEAIDFSPVPGFLVMGFAKDLKAKKANQKTKNGRCKEKENILCGR